VKLSPLERRTFKVKKPTLDFYCALCRTPRQLSTSFRTTIKNYLQIILLTIMTTAICYPIMNFRGVFSFFVFLAGFELVRRANYRKEIPCPHCGFDASWYKKDVKVARRLVADYWAEKNSNTEAIPTAVPTGQPLDEPYEESNFDHRF
jgi:hypothetical protein